VKADMGNIDTKAALGSITDEAMQKIVLKVGGNSITIDQTGIEIKGIMIKIAASAMYEIKGPLGQVKADAMLIIKGGLVMIN
jgi:type VI secretion system secreted protein VgrG